MIVNGTDGVRYMVGMSLSTETFNRSLDKWLKTDRDECKIDNNAMFVAALNNSIVKQAVEVVSVSPAQCQSLV